MGVVFFDSIVYVNICRILVFAPVTIQSVKVQIDDVYLGEAKQSAGPLYVLEWEPFHYIGGLHNIMVQAVVSYKFYYICRL